MLKVHLTPSGGKEGDAFVTHLAPSSEGEEHKGGFEAVLTISCALGPLGTAAEEGITLNVIGGPNFSESTGGNTLFVVTAED